MCEIKQRASVHLHVGPPDPPSSLSFKKLRRGFVIEATSHEYITQPAYAFDKIEDLAKWLIDTYGEPKPAPRRGRRK